MTMCCTDFHFRNFVCDVAIIHSSIRVHVCLKVSIIIVNLALKFGSSHDGAHQPLTLKIHPHCAKPAEIAASSPSKHGSSELNKVLSIRFPVFVLLIWYRGVTINNIVLVIPWRQFHLVSEQYQTFRLSFHQLFLCLHLYFHLLRGSLGMLNVHCP